MEGYTITVGAATDVGRVREGNEDRHLVAGRLLVVADGMGGHAGGEVAAAITVDTFDEHSGELGSAPDPSALRDRLGDAVREAHRRVRARAAQEPDLAEMGTTATAAALAGERVVLAHVGDSRAYLVRDGAAHQLTVDQTYVQRLVERGDLSPAEARVSPHRAMLEQAVGLGDALTVAHPDPVVLRPGDRLLLCSDGLTEVLDDAAIARVLLQHDPAQEAADALVAATLEGGAPDNVTVVVLAVDGPVDEQEPR